MKALYVEPIGGASGNMLLGAFLDLGYPQDELERELRSLDLPVWRSVRETVDKLGVRATYFDFEVKTADAQESLREMVERVRPLPVYDEVRTVFEAYVEATGWTQLPVSMACDLVLDVAGFLLVRHRMGLERIYCAPLPMGQGVVRYHQGVVPNPSPPILHLVRGIPVRPTSIDKETVTVTAAALLTRLASFSPPGVCRFGNCGYGAGKSDFAVPNVVRLQILEDCGAERLCVLETQLDDVNPQWLPVVLDRLLEDGALDVFVTPILMKKGRPGFLLSVLAEEELRSRLEKRIFAELPTLGIRRHGVERTALQREIVSMQTPLGAADFKVRRLPDGRESFTVEFESCRRIAAERGLPVGEVSLELQRWFAATHPTPRQTPG